MPVDRQAFLEAVGDVGSFGTLVTPDYDASCYARFISPGEGDIKIATIDSLGRADSNIALKIDVEGSELEVLRGAQRTIAAAQNVVVTFEAHPAVARRIGRDPISCMQFLNGIRPFQFVVAETGVHLSPDRPLAGTGWERNINILSLTV